jgi:hypothetical protein
VRDSESSLMCRWLFELTAGRNLHVRQGQDGNEQSVRPLPGVHNMTSRHRQPTPRVSHVVTSPLPCAL